jgi:hypothetical protein
LNWDDTQGNFVENYILPIQNGAHRVIIYVSNLDRLPFVINQGKITISKAMDNDFIKSK